jgi:hypothetical protein
MFENFIGTLSQRCFSYTVWKALLRHYQYIYHNAACSIKWIWYYYDHFPWNIQDWHVLRNPSSVSPCSVPFNNLANRTSYLPSLPLSYPIYQSPRISSIKKTSSPFLSPCLGSWGTHRRTSESRIMRGRAHVFGLKMSKYDSYLDIWS